MAAEIIIQIGCERTGNLLDVCILLHTLSLYFSLSLHTHTHTHTNFILTFPRDIFPGRWRVHEGSVLDLVIDVLVLVEGEGAAQADVHDDAH